MKPARDNHGQWAPCHVTAPLCFRAAKSARVAKGNRTRRLNAIRRARELMQAAPDYPPNLFASVATMSRRGAGFLQRETGAAL